MVPPSLTRNSASRTSSGWCSTNHPAPTPCPTSSSAVARKTTSRFSGTPARFSTTSVISSAIPSPFMSWAPRPQMYPSWISPPKGSTDQYSGDASTTSMWLSRMMGRALPSPRRRAYRFALPGAGSNTCASMPSRASTAANQTAARRSGPGRLVMTISRYCDNNWAASFPRALHSSGPRGAVISATRCGSSITGADEPPARGGMTRWAQATTTRAQHTANRSRAMGRLRQGLRCGETTGRRAGRLGRDLLQLLAHFGDLERLAERLEDLPRPLEVGARFVAAPQSGAEQPILLVNLGFERGRALQGLAQLDRLLEEHEPGLVVLPPAHPAHEQIALHQPPVEPVRDGHLLGAAGFFFRLEQPPGAEVQLGELQPDHCLQPRVALIAACPRQGLPVGGDGRRFPSHPRVHLALGVEHTRHGPCLAQPLEAFPGPAQMLAGGRQVAGAPRQSRQALVQLSGRRQVAAGFREPHPAREPGARPGPLPRRPRHIAEPQARGDRARLVELRFGERQRPLMAPRGFGVTPQRLLQLAQGEERLDLGAPVLAPLRQCERRLEPRARLGQPSRALLARARLPQRVHRRARLATLLGFERIHIRGEQRGHVLLDLFGDERGALMPLGRLDRAPPDGEVGAVTRPLRLLLGPRGREDETPQREQHLELGQQA